MKRIRMNRTTSIGQFSLALSVMLCSIGCDLEPGTLESLQEAVTTLSAQQSVVIQEDEQPDIPEGTFVAPNPDRVDPFSFPDSAPSDLLDNIEKIFLLADKDEFKIQKARSTLTVSTLVADRQWQGFKGIFPVFGQD